LEARYQLRTIDPKTGARGPHGRTINGGDSVAIDVQTDGPRIIWLVR